MILCTWEDRADHIIALKLLIMSFRRWCPDWKLVVFAPADLMDFSRWGGGNVDVRPPLPELLGHGWNVKAGVLLHLLEEHDSAIWIDSDIVIASDPRRIFSRNNGAILVGEEPAWIPDQSSVPRTRAWGLSVGREITRAVNSCVVRVDRTHRGLLNHWSAAMLDERYTHAQRHKTSFFRPLHLKSDQDVLAALLGSTEFAGIQLEQIRRGVDIAQCFLSYGFSFGERLRCVAYGMPPLIHAQSAPKPWQLGGHAQYELSPYNAIARQYAAELDEPIPWAFPTSRLGRIADMLWRGHPVFRGIHQTAISQMRAALALRTRLRWLKCFIFPWTVAGR